jgi:hypothetical protein
MGTRNLTCVFIDGGYKVAQYGQWDGYPSGQGLVVLRFARDLMEADLFKTAVRNCRYGSAEEIKLLWEKAGADGLGLVSIEVSEKFKKQFPHLYRDGAAKVLEHIQNTPSGLVLRNSLEFAGDSMFCEWAYVLDLDAGKLEVFKGFNQEPLTRCDRFYDQPKQHKDYYQVRLFQTFDLAALPTNDEFVAACAEPAEEEAA